MKLLIPGITVVLTTILRGSMARNPSIDSIVGGVVIGGLIIGGVAIVISKHCGDLFPKMSLLSWAVWLGSLVLAGTLLF